MSEVKDFTEHPAMKGRPMFVRWVFDNTSHSVVHVQCFATRDDPEGERGVFVPACGFSNDLKYMHATKEEAVAEARKNYTLQRDYFQEKLDELENV